RRNSRGWPARRASAWRPAPATRSAAASSQPAQPLGGRLYGGVALGKAQPQQARARRAFAERRQRNRRHAAVLHQPATEGEIVIVADRRVIDQLEIAARHVEQLETRGRQQRAEAVALGPVERRQ